MKAAELSRVLRQVGFTFVICLVFSIRIDGRPVLLALQAAAVVWQLRGLQAFAASPEAERAWRGAFGSALACVPIGVIGLVPAVDAGLVNLVGAIVLVFGLVSYCSLLALWCHRVEWPDAALAYDRSRRWLVVTLGVIALAVAALLALGTRAGPADRLADATIVLDRVAEGWPSLVAVLAATAAWIVGLVSLQIANRKVRVGLAEQGDAEVPLA